MKSDPEVTIKIPNFKSGFNTTSVRSRNMSKIRGTEARSELALRKTLWSLGIRYRKNYSKLPGKPDVAILQHHIVIFIDGEFWHGYNWAINKERIKTNREY